MNDFHITLFTEEDSVEELTELLHLSYKRLADMGLKFVATYQSAEYTKNFIADKGECFIVKNDEGKIIATIMMLTNDDDYNPDWYKNDFVAHFGKFAVHPDYQSSGIGGMMMDYIEKYAISKNKSELALDTSEKALHLIEYYKKRGYRFIEYHQWDVTNYRSVILSKKLVKE